MEEKLNRRPHKLEVTGRGTGSVTGIQDVVSFDENQIILDTDMGLLTVKGKSLHVSRLTLEKGEVDMAYAHAAKATAKRSLVWTIWRAQK